MSVTDWSYRKEIRVSRASGAVSDYQMLFKIYYGNGVDGTETVLGESAAKMYCDSKCNTDFSDIRFTASDGWTVLDYWIQTKVDSDYAIIWVELDYIDTDDTIFYVYYGNATASSISSGADTFPLFDDFERGNDGDAVGGDWTVASGSVKISTDHAYSGTRSGKWEGGAARAIARQDFSALDNQYAIRFHFWKEDLVYAGPSIYHGGSNKLLNCYVIGDESVYYYDDTGGHDTGSDVTPDAWQYLEFKNIDFTGGTYDIYLNGSVIKDDANLQSAPAGTYNDLIQLMGDNSANPGRDVYYDSFFVRSWRPTGPAWGDWGEEESITTDRKYMLFVHDLAPSKAQYFLAGIDMAIRGNKYLYTEADVKLRGAKYLLQNPNVIYGGAQYLLSTITMVSRIPKPSYGRIYQRLSSVEKEVT